MGGSSPTLISLTMFTIKYTKTAKRWVKSAGCFIDSTYWTFNLFGIGKCLVPFSDWEVAENQPIYGYISSETKIPTIEVQKRLKQVGIEFLGVVHNAKGKRLKFDFTAYMRKVYGGNLLTTEPYYKERELSTIL